MKIATLVTSFLLILAGFFLLCAGPADAEEDTCYFLKDGEREYLEYDCSEIRVTGDSLGNHDLDCTVIQPWPEGGGPDPRDVPYPIIGWANGWNFGNVVGEHTTEGYKLGLIEWALDGPYIVVAANQWSVQETDVLACMQWVLENYEGIADPDSIGLSGHSQGGGAVIKAGAGSPDVTATIAMNPYGPNWVDSGNQDGPMMLLGGTHDTTTPVSSFIAVWEAIQENKGGLLAVLEGGTHNSEAWGVDENGSTLDYHGAAEKDFGQYQDVTELWWQKHLNGNSRSGRTMKRILDKAPWDTGYAFSEDFKL